MIMPVFVPIAQQLGIDLVHYGILITTVMGIALFLPPFGVGLYIVLGLSGATLGELSKYLLPYLATMTVIAVLCFFAGLILDTVTRGRREVRRLAYLSLAAPGQV